VAIITEPDACSTDENVQSTLRAIERAVTTQHVDLISVRLQGDATTAPPETLERAHFLTKRLLELSRRRYPLEANEPILEERSTKRTNFYVVCSSDWIQVAVECRSHGIHVKEAHLKHIPDWISLFDYDILIGTSAHSIESALKSSIIYRPHYYFVGTCFLTESHPEKSEEELEGPLLPGKIKESLRIDGRGDGNSSIPVFAIGGIDETNCWIPIEAGADGVAVIRSILKADRPDYAISNMYKIMKNTSMKSQRDL
jgi:thiamine monophosphate synthase